MGGDDEGGMSEVYGSVWSARRDGSVLRIGGEVDAFTADDVAERLVAEVRDGIAHVDLSEVEFFGAAGVRVLLAGGGAAQLQGMTLDVVCPRTVMRVLDVCAVAEEDGVRVHPLGVSGNGQG
jgi:anti-anti-sigma factor